MPRIRSLKPEFATDEKLATVSRDARLTFALCIAQADCDGLLGGTPRQLLGTLYPHDLDVTDAMLETWLQELCAIGSGRWRETEDGARVFELVHWREHQRIDHRSKPILAQKLKPLPATAGVPGTDARTAVDNPAAVETSTPAADAHIGAPDDPREGLGTSSRGPRESLARASEHPREALARVSRAEVDLGPRILDLGPRTPAPPPTPTPPPRAREVAVEQTPRLRTELAESGASSDEDTGSPEPLPLDPHFPAAPHREAYRALRARHQLPEAFDAGLREIAAPSTGGVAYPWPVIGAALVQLLANGMTFNVALVRGMCRSDQGRAAQSPASPVAAVGARAAPRGPVVQIGEELFDGDRITQLCEDAGLLVPMQSREMIHERILDLAASGRIPDAPAFESLVLALEPWRLAEIKFGGERARRLDAKLREYVARPPRAVRAVSATGGAA